MGILKEIYQLSADRRDQRATEVALRDFEQLLSDGEFVSVDGLLGYIDVDRVCATALLAILSITYHGKDRLPHRGNFMKRVRDRLAKELGEMRTEKLLMHRS